MTPPDIPPPTTCSEIDTGDTVRHGPTGETWRVACVQGDRLSWCGWPEGWAETKDCTLLTKATPEARLKLLHEMAAIEGSDHRKRHAVAALQSSDAAASTGWGPEAYALSIVRREMAGRKGHGGGPHTRRVMWPADIARIAREAFEAGRAHAKSPNAELSDAKRSG